MSRIRKMFDGGADRRAGKNMGESVKEYKPDRKMKERQTEPWVKREDQGVMLYSKVPVRQ